MKQVHFKIAEKINNLRSKHKMNFIDQNFIETQSEMWDIDTRICSYIEGIKNHITLKNSN